MDKNSRSIINKEEYLFVAPQLPRQTHESKKSEKSSSSKLDSSKSYKSKSSSSSSSKHHSSSSKHLSSETSHRSSKSSEHRDKDHKKRSESKSSDKSHKRSREEVEFKDTEPKSKKSKSDEKSDKTKSSSSKSSSLSHKTDKHKSSSSSSSRSSKPKPAQLNIQTPDLLTQKPKLDLSPDLVDDLNVSAFNFLPPPSKSPNNEQAQPKQGPTESELLTKSISSIKSRTRIFSGNTRGGSAIPKLNDMCLRVLTLHLDYVGCIGDIPFEILRPALEKAKPEQLTKIEYYNPYLLEDSDILWKTICQRKWRNRQPVEMESWREMYERCNREDEEKLNRLTKNIRQTQQQSSNCIQKTKIAFVDTVVKGPRGIARKPEPFSSTRKPVMSLAVRVEALKSSKPNFVVPKDVQSRIATSFRDGPQPIVKRGGVQRTTLSKPASMMAKLLSKFRR